MPVNESMLGRSVRGASHIRHGTPMEDYSAIERFWRSNARPNIPAAPVQREEDEPDALLMAVSDGHGDPRCMRSSAGSEMAVKTALCALRDFLESLEANGTSDFWNDPDEHIGRITAQIAENWRHLVLCDLDERPLDEREREQAADLLAVYESGQRREHIYGATLIAGALTPEFLLLLQKGDGHAVLIDEEGRADANVIPWDERCEGNVTTSLCDQDAAQTFCTRLIDLRAQRPALAAVFLGTDGVEDSYADMEGACAYYSDLAARCALEGVQTVQEGLEEELSQMSRLGSNDDVSLTGILCLPRLAPLTEQLKAPLRRYNARVAYERYHGRLLSMARRREKAERESGNAQTALEAAQREQLQGERELAQLHEDASAQRAAQEKALQALLEQQQALEQQIRQMEEDNRRFNEESQKITDELYQALDRIRTQLCQYGHAQAVRLSGRPFDELETERQGRTSRYETACEQRRALRQQIEQAKRACEEAERERRCQIAQWTQKLEDAQESVQKAQKTLEDVTAANEAFWTEYGDIERLAQEAKRLMEPEEPARSDGAVDEPEA